MRICGFTFNQSGTDDPVITNQIGDERLPYVVWTRSSADEVIDEAQIIMFIP